MTQRTFWTVVLIASLFPINEIHQLFQAVHHEVNPWLWRDYPLDIQWYVKFLCMQLSDVLKAVIIYRLSRMNGVLRLSATVFLIYTGFDTFLFFGDFNEGKHVPYVFFYSLTGIGIIVFAHRQFVRRKRGD